MAKTRTGVVTAVSNFQTIRVRVDRMVNHPKYGKRFRVSKNYAVHDPINQTHIGDSVSIVEMKPISKTKTWRLVNVLKSGVQASEVIDSPIAEVTK